MRQKAFTLLEVMVALAVLSIALVAILSYQASSIDLAHKAMIITKATFVAQEKMAHIIGQQNILEGKNEGELMEDIPSFGWKTMVEEQNEPEGLLKVTVIVTWQEGDTERELRLVTYVISKP